LPHEWASAIPLCAIALAMGVFPNVFLRPMEASVTRVVDRLTNVRTLRVENVPTPATVKVAR
jgi:NADH:ubiquinone oxidoreductase subunit 4 (subunit M)